MGFASFVTDVLWGLARAAARFSRKKSKPQQAAEDAGGFGRNHALRVDGSCIYCDETDAVPGARCAGPALRAR